MVSLLPQFRHHICAHTPGGTITEFNQTLSNIFGEQALNMEKNPALANWHPSLCNAGNGLMFNEPTGHITESGHANTKPMFMSCQTLDKGTQAEYENPTGS